MRYADIKEVDVANGIGIRVSLFVSGCRHRCKGCFNQVAWEFDYGSLYTKETEEYILKLLDRPYINGFTFLGGEPLEKENQEEVCNLIKIIRNTYTDKTIWLYTGFTYEYLMNEMAENSPYIKDILSGIDVMVDGKFEEDKKDLKLKFRGSSNQRIIDMNRTNSENGIVLWE